MDDLKSHFTKKSIILFFSYIVDFFIMVIPACGYLDTTRIMIETQSPAAFNPIQCIILISAQGLKIFYRIFHPYAARVFGQSVSQFTVAFLMVYLKYRYSKPQPQSKHEKISTEKMNFPYYFYILRMKSFFEFLISFSLYLSIISVIFYIGYNFIDEKSSIETIGIIANLIETTIVLPLFYKVVIQRDIKNLSKILVIQFASGDIMRLVLFILSNAPISFIAGVCLQITLDLIMFANYLKLYFCSENENVKQEMEELIPKTQFDDVDNDASLSLEENEKDKQIQNQIDVQNEKLNDESFPIASNI